MGEITEEGDRKMSVTKNGWRDEAQTVKRSCGWKTGRRKERPEYLIHPVPVYWSERRPASPMSAVWGQFLNLTQPLASLILLHSNKCWETNLHTQTSHSTSDWLVVMIYLVRINQQDNRPSLKKWCQESGARTEQNRTEKNRTEQKRTEWAFGVKSEWHVIIHPFGSLTLS